VKEGVEDDLGAVADGPANGLGIAPAFMADGDAEGEVSGAENVPGLAGGVGVLFLGGELDFVLEAGDGAVAMDDEDGGAEGVVHETFGSKDNGDVGAAGGVGDGLVGAIEEGGVGRRDGFVGGAVTGDEALGKTEDVGVGVGGGEDGGLGESEGVVGRGWEAEVGQGDARHGVDMVAQGLLAAQP
jgi:hypothetical protein